MAPIAFRPEQDLMSAFATPIVRVPVLQANSINPNLKAAILQREGKDPPRARSNHGGWQSQSDLLTWPIPEVKVLTEAIYEAVRQVQKTVCEVKGKQFDLMLYPNKTHGITGSDHNVHLYTMIFEYLERHL